MVMSRLRRTSARRLGTLRQPSGPGSLGPRFSRIRMLG